MSHPHEYQAPMFPSTILPRALKCLHQCAFFIPGTNRHTPDCPHDVKEDMTHQTMLPSSTALWSISDAYMPIVDAFDRGQGTTRTLTYLKLQCPLLIKLCVLISTLFSKLCHRNSSVGSDHIDKPLILYALQCALSTRDSVTLVHRLSTEHCW